jgi:hypothetical protein
MQAIRQKSQQGSELTGDGHGGHVGMDSIGLDWNGCETGGERRRERREHPLERTCAYPHLDKRDTTSLRMTLEKGWGWGHFLCCSLDCWLTGTVPFVYIQPASADNPDTHCKALFRHLRIVDDKAKAGTPSHLPGSI